MSKDYRYPFWVKGYGLGAGQSLTLPYEDIAPTENYGKLIAVGTAGRGVGAETFTIALNGGGELKRVKSCRAIIDFDGIEYAVRHSYYVVDPAEGASVDIQIAAENCVGIVAVWQTTKEIWQALFGDSPPCGLAVVVPNDDGPWWGYGPGQYDIPQYYGREHKYRWMFSILGQEASGDVDFLAPDGNSVYPEYADVEKAVYEQHGYHVVMMHDDYYLGAPPGEVQSVLEYIKLNRRLYVWGSMFYMWVPEEEPTPPPSSPTARRACFIFL